MKNINIIQVVLIGVSIVAIVTAVIMFSLFTGRGAKSSNGTVVLWGTIPYDDFEMVLQNLNNNGDKIDGLQYVQKDESSINDELLKAIANGTGPDLVLLDEKQIIENQKRIQVIPFESYPLRTYQDMFLDESSLLVTSEGILGFPFLVDPLVMYYNKNILSNAGFSRPPETWTEVLALAPTLTQKDSSFNISKSTIALGSFDNIKNAKDIFWTLVLQAGNPVIKRNTNIQTENVPEYEAILDQNLNFTLNPAYAATNFFTQFSNPTKTVYSWNRSLPSSQTAFVSGDLALYIGYASELESIQRLNPNLSFDVAMIPQSQNSTRKVTYGSMSTLAITRTSPNIRGAVNVIAALTSKDVQSEFVKILGIPSGRKDLLVTNDPANPYQSVFNRSAIIAQGVLEPDVLQTTTIIKELIDTIVSGEYEISDALQRANQKLSLIFSNE